MTTATPAPPLSGASASFPSPGIMLVTINRPKQRNSIPFKLHWQLHALFHWFDKEPSLNVAVITGEGDKSFCAGQDLIELGKYMFSRSDRLFNTYTSVKDRVNNDLCK